MLKKKILFIEDEPDHIMMIRARLEASGFDFISAVDGEEGVKKIRREKPDLILLDIVMPKMDGYQVCKEIKKDKATAHIPILIITASGVKDLEEKCLQAGASEIIKKPFESEDLVSKIRALTER